MKRRALGMSGRYGQRHLHLEPLESRSLLTGDVMAAFDLSGNLFLTGDAKANNINLSYDTTAGAYLLSGLNTTINGGFAAVNLNTLLGATFNGTIIANLDGGNDVVTISGASGNSGANLSGVTLSTGLGNDTVTLNGLTIANDVVVNGGAGDDSINVTNVAAAGNASISAGAGNDIVTV